MKSAHFTMFSEKNKMKRYVRKEKNKIIFRNCKEIQ